MNKSISLEGLRGIACLSVVNAHFGFVFLPYLSYYLNPPQEGAVPKYLFDAVMSQSPWNLIFNGNLGVCIFFVISGYVLTAKYYERKDPIILRIGAIKRYPRLVLPAFVSVLFAYAILAAGQMRNHLAGLLGASGWVLQHYSETTTLLHSIYVGLIGAPIFGDVMLNVPLWTLHIEIVGSLLLFALYYLFGLNHKILLLLCFVFFSLALGNPRPFAFYMLGSPLYYFSFILGSFLNLTEEWLKQRQLFSGIILLLGIIVSCVDYSPTFSFINSIPLPNLMPYSVDFNAQQRLFYYSIGAVLMVAGILGFRPAAKILSKKIFAYLGKLSFSIYLLHWPIICSFSFWAVQKSFLYTNKHFTSLVIAYVLTCIVIWILSVLFYRFVDKPSIQFSSWLAKAICEGSLRLDLERSLLKARGDLKRLIITK